MSVLADFLVNGLNPSTVGGTGTAVKYFPRLFGGFNVESTAPSATSSTGQLVVPGNSALEAQWFEVLVGGTILSGVADSSVTAKASLYANTAALGAAPSYTEIATTGLLTAPLENTSYGFALKVQLFGSTKSGVVRGFQNGIFGANNIAQASLTNNLSGISMASSAPFGLVVGVTFGTGNSTNKASLFQFQITQE
jgi:hypothetical protein